METKPATEYEKGMSTATQIISRQAEAGQGPEVIRGKQESALGEYNPETATPAQKEWAQGYMDTAGTLIQDLGEMERNETELDREAG